MLATSAMLEAQHYDKTALPALSISIAIINVWNRINVTVRQIASDSGQ